MELAVSRGHLLSVHAPVDSTPRALPSTRQHSYQSTYSLEATSSWKPFSTLDYRAPSLGTCYTCSEVQSHHTRSDQYGQWSLLAGENPTSSHKRQTFGSATGRLSHLRTAQRLSGWDDQLNVKARIGEGLGSLDGQLSRQPRSVVRTSHCRRSVAQCSTSCFAEFAKQSSGLQICQASASTFNWSAVQTSSIRGSVLSGSGLGNLKTGEPRSGGCRNGSQQRRCSSVQPGRRGRGQCREAWPGQGPGRSSDSADSASQPSAEWTTGLKSSPVAAVKSLTDDFEGRGETRAVPVTPCIPVPSNSVELELELGQRAVVHSGLQPGGQAPASPSGALAYPDMLPTPAKEGDEGENLRRADSGQFGGGAAAPQGPDGEASDTWQRSRGGIDFPKDVASEECPEAAEAVPATDSAPPKTGSAKGGWTQLRNRVVFGTLIGLGAGWAIVAGNWWFTVAFAVVTVLGSWEYFGLVDARAARNQEPPTPPLSAKLCCAMCCAMPLMTMYSGGRIGWAVASAIGMLAALLVVQPQRPTRSQLSNMLFGLFYCGYLPSFWIKLRCGLPPTLLSPTTLTPLAQAWPAALGGPSQWTVGLVATFIGFATIIAADTGAYLGGKSFGRTKLIDISPKKTREGAAAGLASAVVVAVGLSQLFRWPASVFSAATMGVLVFMASLFGDLSESMLKRDAGVKDSGRLIPGHGGILDRTDSYIFTGALVYSFVKIGLPLFGV